MAETAVIAAIAAKTGASAATVVAVGAAATAAVASIAISSVQAKKAEADSRKDSARAPRDITVRSAIEPARIIYGEARTSGPVVYTNTASTPGTTDNSTLWTVISLCNHEVEDITDVWLDGDKILASQIVGGNVTSGKYGPIGSNYITNIYKRYGTSTQTHVTQLASAFTDWTDAYDGRGVAYIVTGFELGTATGEGVWAQGAPQNIRAVVKGKKVYDPRKDSTNGGSGTHRLADPTTWEWSDNPALCVADYLFDDRLGMGAEGITYDEIDWAMVTTAANVCDATVTSPAGNQKRFTCNGALSTGETYAENIKQLLSSMAGSLTWSGGKFRIRALAYEAPTYTFTGDDVIGDVQIQPETSRAQRFNLVRGTFIDPASDYVATEFIPVENTTFRDDRDGGQTLNKQIKLPFTNNEYMAQRIAYKQLNVADQQLRCVVPMNYKAMKVAVGDRIQLSIEELSWSNKPFLVEGWVFSPNGGYELTLQEESSSAYADPALGDYSTRTWAGSVVFPDPDVPAPSGLAATNEQEAVLLTWDAPSRPSAYDEVVVYASSSSAWSGASEIGRTRGTTFRHEIDIVPATYPTSATYYYWVRAVDIQGEESIRNPNSDTSSVQGIAQKITTTSLNDDANFASTANWPDITGTGKPEDNATYNTGALADLDTVGTNQIDDNAVDITKIADTLQSTNYSAGSAGWKLTTDGTFEAGNGTFRGALTATSLTIDSSATVSGFDISDLENARYVDALYVRGTGNNNIANQVLKIGTTEVYNTGSRGFRLSVIKRADHSVLAYRRGGTSSTTLAENQSYDVYISEAARIDLRDALVELRTNSNGTRASGEYGSDIIVVITSYDAHNLNTTNGALLIAEMKNNGATARIDDSSSSYHRVPYILIGVAGCGEGNGIEVMTGLAATDPYAEYFGTLVDGEIRGVIDSLRDGVIINNGGITLDGGGAIKTIGKDSESDSTNGFFIGYNGTNYTVGIGDSTNKLVWNGSSLTVAGSITATSGSIASGVTLNGTATSDVVTGAAAGATALQNGDDITDGSIGGVTIESTKLYQGTGTFNNSNTGFYLDSTGQFSLKDKLAFFPTNNTLRVKGNIEADVITVNQNLQVVGDLKASSLAVASITREMFTQDALDEIYGALATAVGGSNGDYKEASGSFTTSGGTVTLALFDHGESNVVVEWLENYGFAQTIDYTGTALQATLTFEASTVSDFSTIAATKTETITLGKYDLSVYYGSTYIWYYGPRSVTKTFTTTDLADTTDYYFRVRVTSVGAAFTGITYPFELEANEGVTGVVSTGGNADTLDNLDSTAFLRSNVDDTFDGNLTVTGNLTVNGTTVTLNTATLDVEDKNITLNYGAGDTSASADGAGITIQDAVDASTDATILWDATNDRFDFSHSIAFDGTATTTNQGRGIFWTGYDKEGVTDYTDAASIRHTTNTGGHTGSVLVISSQNDAADGIAFSTHANSKLKHNNWTIWTAQDFSNNSSNWDAAYTYSQVGHVPLAGGTMTGTLKAPTVGIGSPLTGAFPESTALLDVATTTAQTNFSSNALTYGSDRAQLILDSRHSATKDTVLGYAAPMLDFRANNTSSQWSLAQIIGTVDPENGSNHQGGLVFATSGGGSTDPTGRRNNGAAPTARMLIGAGGNVTILTGDLKFGTSPVTVIDSSRNISNVGTISSTHLVTETNTTKDGEGPYDWVTAGSGARGAALRINDITGANYIIRTGGYDLTFMKHVDAATDDFANVMKFEANDAASTGANVRVYSDLIVQGSLSLSGYNSSNWDTAYSAVNATNLGDTATGLVSFTSQSDWSKPAGYSSMIRGTGTNTSVVGTPKTASYWYYQVIGKRDGLGGTAALLTNYTGNDLYFGHAATDVAPTWRRLWSDNDFSQPLELSGGTMTGALTTTGATIGGNQTNTSLTVEASNTAGAAATTAIMTFKGYEGRGLGTFYEDSSYSGEEWFAGMPYAGQFNAFQIGYDEAGGQAEYAANSIARFTSSGDFQMGTTTVIDASRNLVGINEATLASYLNVQASTGIRSTGWVHLQRYAVNLNVSVGNNGTNVNLLVPNGSIQVGGTTAIDSSRNLTNIGTISSTGAAIIDANGYANTLHIWDDAASGQPGMIVTDTGAQSTSTQTLYVKQYGSGIAATLFGQSVAGKSILATEGSASGGLLIGTLTNDSVWVGTNNTAALTINGSQAASFSGTITSAGRITGTYNAGHTGWSNVVIDAAPSAGGAFIRANRASAASGEVGFAWADGGSNKWINYLATSGTQLQWYAGGAAHVMSLTTGGVLNTTGGYQVNGTTVLDASRNLTSIGSITTSGNVSVGGNFVIDTDTGSQKFQINRIGTSLSHNQALRVHVDDSNVVFESQQDETDRYGGYQFNSKHGTTVRTRLQITAGSDSEVTMYASNGNGAWRWDGTNLRQGINKVAPDYTLDVAGTINGSNYRLGTVEVIDSSRNLVNIGTISSGAITSGTINAPQIYSSSGSGVKLGNFNGSDADQWPHVIWYRDTANGWDEGLIKGSSSRGVFSRAHFGIHIDDARSFAFHSSGWDTEMEICGDGRIYQKGPVFIARTSAWSNATLSVEGAGYFKANDTDSRVLYLRDRSNDTGNILQFQNYAGTNIWEVVGRANGTYPFYVYKNTGTGSGYKWGITQSGDHQFFGNITGNANITAYSDARLKTDVETLDGAKVLQMRGVSFKRDGEAGSGVIAQELEQVAPELVMTAEDEMGTKSVAYGNLVGYLIEAVKMQQQQIDRQQAQINELIQAIKEKDNGDH